MYINYFELFHMDYFVLQCNKLLTGQKNELLPLVH